MKDFAEKSRVQQAGFSLVEVLVAAALMGALALSMASMIKNQIKDMKSMQEKLGSLDLQRQLISTIADGSVCGFELNNPSPKTFDETTIGTQTPPKIILTQIHAKASATSPVIAEVDANPSPMVNTLKIKKIYIENIKSSGVPNEYEANLKISFDQQLTVRPMKPIVAGIRLSTDPDPLIPVTAKKIVGCAGEGGQGFQGQVFALGVKTSGYTAVNTKSYPILVTASGGNAGGACNTCELNSPTHGLHQADNNPQWAKACSITFPVAAGATYTITSSPWGCGAGSFQVTEFR